MAKNQYKWLLILGLIFCLGCETLKRRDDLPSDTGTQRPSEEPTQEIPVGEPDEDPDAEPVPSATRKKRVRQRSVGLILGPGFFRTFGHGGALKAIEESKIDVKALAGLGMGSLFGAHYAQFKNINTLEWKLFQMKEETFLQKSMLSGGLSPSPIKGVQKYLSKIFGNKRLNHGKIPFVCPTLNLSKPSVFLVSTGSVSSSLLNCLSVSPFVEPYKKKSASLGQLHQVLRWMRAQKIEKIIYLNVLPRNVRMSDLPLASQVYWSEMVVDLEHFKKSMDYVVDIPFEKRGILVYSDRRRVFLSGYNAMKGFLQKEREALFIADEMEDQ